ncbi:MAG: hypothetical protein ACO3I4_03020 [Candidatus Kapaibacteriota bacterium]|jgi:hypothetical protein
MVRRIILIAAAIAIPLVVTLAIRYGQQPTATFEQAIQQQAGQSEQEQSAKVVILTTITENSGGQIYGEDRQGRRFRVDYTGHEFEGPLLVGSTYRFVGHVHGQGTDAYFHATQVYNE